MRMKSIVTSQLDYADCYDLHSVICLQLVIVISMYQYMNFHEIQQDELSDVAICIRLGASTNGYCALWKYCARARHSH